MSVLKFLTVYNVSVEYRLEIVPDIGPQIAPQIIPEILPEDIGPETLEMILLRLQTQLQVEE